MGLVLTTIAGLCLWIVLWATGTKAFDAFLLTLGMVVLATTVRMILPSLPGSRPDPDEPA
jgi:Mn2+/Fe2+ NRAMP family transporter